MLWERYSHKLVALARRRLPADSRRLTDEDDIVQSVFIALCRGADKGRLQALASRDDLWWFLLTLTRRKIVSRMRTDAAQKRGGGHMVSAAGPGPSGGTGLGDRFEELVSDDPTPEFLVMLDEEHQRLLRLLRDDQLRCVAVWRIEGYSIDEIAAKLQIAPRSVARKLDLIRNTWASEVGR